MTRPLRLVTADDPPKGPHPMPERWSEAQRAEIVAWAIKKRFCKEELQFATDTVRDWAEAKSIRRANWPAQLKNAMRSGWALRGFEKAMKREGKVEIITRTGESRVKRTPITEERIGE